MTPARERIPSGLTRAATAAVLIVLMVGSAVLMHSLSGHASAHASSASTSAHSHDEGTFDGGTAVHAASAPLAVVDDCGGLCAMLCAIMGMACLMVLVLSRAVNAAPRLPRLALPRLAPDLAQLSIIRI
jgi:uncharacterized membrane protein YeiB